MRVKIQHHFNDEIKEEEVTPIYKCHHVEDRKYYATLKDVEFDETSEYILIENPNSCYGFSALWLKDRKNKIYEYDGFGHSGACSIVSALLKELTNKEQECESLAFSKGLLKFEEPIQNLNEVNSEVDIVFDLYKLFNVTNINFNTEKQLKLLTFVATNFGGFEVNFKDGKFSIDGLLCGSGCCETLSDAIIHFISMHHQFMSHDFRKEVHDILSE